MRWKPSQRSLGGNNTEEKRLSENKVRLMRLISNRHVMLVCGANAQEFSCRKYQVGVQVYVLGAALRINSDIHFCRCFFYILSILQKF